MGKLITVILIIIAFLAFLFVLRTIQRMYTIVNCKHTVTKDETYIIKNSLGHPIAKFKGTTCTKCKTVLEYRAIPMED